MTNKNSLHISRGDTSLRTTFIQSTWKKSAPFTPPPPFTSVRFKKQIPLSVLEFFQMDPRTHQSFTSAEKLFYAQVFMHEIDEGTRILARVGKHQDAKMLNNYSNKMHFANRLELLRNLIEEIPVTKLTPERIQHLHKARNNQWGAIKLRLNPHHAIALTETGIGYKERNEDAFLVMSDQKVMALADGMGGHVGGHIASCIAIDFFEYAVNQGMEIDEAIAYANQAILVRSKSDEKLGGMRPMGCTFAAFQVQDSSVKIAHVGDTKVMVIRDGKIYFETQDHTQGQQLLQEGLIDCPTAFELNHILNRCLGMDTMRAQRDVSVTSVLLKPGDRILTATDGITDNFFSSDFRLDELAEMACQGSLSQAANFLVDACLSRMLSASLPDGRASKCDNLALGMMDFHGDAE